MDPTQPLQAQHQQQLLLEDGSQKKRWCGRIMNKVIGIGSAIMTVTTIALRYLTPWGSKPPVATTLLPMATGLSIQTAVNALVPTRYLRPILRLEMRNAILISFIFTQFGLNFEVPALLEALVGVGGTWIAAKIVLIIGPKLADIARTTGPQIKSGVLHLCCKPKTNVAHAARHLIKIGGGGALIGLDYFIPILSPHGQNIGLLIIGDDLGDIFVRIACELKRKHEENAQNVEWEDEIPSSVIWMDRVFNLSHVLGTQSLGIILFFTHPAAYFFAGVDIGAILASNEISFEKGINDEVYRLPTADGIQRVINTLVPLAGSGWYIAGMVTAKNTAAKVALSVMTGGAISGAGVTALANRRFRPGENGPLMNSLRFYTREANIVWIIPSIYIQNYMRIGNIALSKLEPLEQIFASIAWFSIGGNVGNSLFTPLVNDVSPGAQIQMSHFIAWMLAGQPREVP